MKKLVFLFAFMALVGLTAGAWAASEATPGPSVVIGARIASDLGYQNLSKELTVNKKDDVTTAFTNLSSSSYLRSTITAPDKTTGALVEFSVSSTIGNNEAAGLRYAYGWWKVGNCKLTAGQADNLLGSLAYGPVQLFGSQQSGKETMRMFGFRYGGRNPQVNFQWANDSFTFMIAAVQPSSEIALSGGSAADTYANLPRFDVAAEFKAGGFSMAPGFGWSQVKFQGVAAGADDSTSQWIFILPIKFTTGPFTAKFQAHAGSNVDVEWSGQKLSALDGTTRGIPVFSSKGKVTDTTQSGGILSLEYKVGSLTLAAGYGFEKLANDYWKQANGYKNEDLTRSGWFIALPYAVTKNFTVQPEVGYYNFGDDLKTNKDAGNEWLAGLAFRFVF